jgi:predicted XRE-type DNA-binding protein
VHLAALYLLHGALTDAGGAGQVGLFPMARFACALDALTDGPEVFCHPGIQSILHIPIGVAEYAERNRCMEPHEIVAALSEAGLTQQQIADRLSGMGVEVTQPYVSKIARRAVDDVKSRTYRALVQLHADVVGQVQPVVKTA